MLPEEPAGAADPVLDEGRYAYFDTRDAAPETVGDNPAEQREALVSATVRFLAGHPAESGIVLTEGHSLGPRPPGPLPRERGARVPAVP